MSRAEIFEKLKEILVSADEKNKDKVDSFTESSELAADLGLNSIGILYIVIAIEETFSVRFDDASMSDFRTIGDTIDYIEKMIS